MKQLDIYHISGIDEEVFSELSVFDLDLKFHKTGITASVDYNLIDFIVVSTIVISTDILKDLIKDYTKSVLNTLKDKILNIWQNLKQAKPVILKSRTTSSEQSPMFRVIIRDKDGGEIIMEFDPSMSEDLISAMIDKHLNALVNNLENIKTKTQE